MPSAVVVVGVVLLLAAVELDMEHMAPRPLSPYPDISLVTPPWPMSNQLLGRGGRGGG